MKYQQLTEGKRYQISVLLSSNYSYRQIAQKLEVAPSTISREISRNGFTRHNYTPHKAQLLTVRRREAAKKRSISLDTKALAIELLNLQWSPEQVSKVLTQLGWPISHETIYQMLIKDFKTGGELYINLRHKLKKYKSRTHKQRGRILDRKPISARPKIVEKNQRYGDWEVDTVIGKRGTGVIVSALERKSRLYKIKKIPRKDSKLVANALIEMLSPYKPLVHTITADNGLEFSEHKKVATELQAEFYFADPYASYQRGANENANGLLRQYIPKGASMKNLTDEDIKFYQTRLNLRPRKCLSFRQPEVVFAEQLEYARSVAVNC